LLRFFFRKAGERTFESSPWFRHGAAERPARRSSEAGKKSELVFGKCLANLAKTVMMKLIKEKGCGSVVGSSRRIGDGFAPD
jgi:hypothetical protein